MRICQTVDTFPEEPFPPNRHDVDDPTDLHSDHHVVEPVSSRENNPGTLHITLTRRSFSDHRSQPLTILSLNTNMYGLGLDPTPPNGDTSAQRAAPSATVRLHPCSSADDH